MKVVIRVSSNSKTTEHICALFEDFKIGRGPSSNCQIDDDRVSSNHCRLYLKKDRLEIFDEDSKNGTYLNGIRIDHSEVFIGDVIKIGETQVSLVEAHMDQGSVDLLTFPGPHKDRLTYELKADFTGARIQNQLFEKGKNQYSQNTPSQRKEIAIRKLIQSDLVLSKEEIRVKFDKLAVVSNFLDLFIVLALCAVPYFIVMDYKGQSFLGLERPVFEEWKDHICGLIVLIVIGSYYVMNKINKFTVGEKLAGIEDKHRRQ